MHTADDYVRSIQNDYMILGFLVDSSFGATSSVTSWDVHIHSPRIALICAIELSLLALLLLKATS